MNREEDDIVIRIKLLSEPEYRQAMRRKEDRKAEYEEVLQGKEYHEYYKGDFCIGSGDFYNLLMKKSEFTDEESCALLRYMHGEVAVRGKLYRGVTSDGKACMPLISEEAKYGLVLIENSRQGIYTTFEPQVTEENMYSISKYTYLDTCQCPSVWEALASLDMDIFLIFRKKDLSLLHDHVPINTPFIVENYPMDGGLKEVYVSSKPWHNKEDTYNGLPWIDNYFFDLRYQWQEDIDELIAVIDSALEYRFPDRSGTATRWLSEQEMDNEIWNDFATENRWIPILIVEEYRDGSYYLRTEADKNPFFYELYDIAEEAKREDANILVLPLDVEDPMNCAENINKVVCAFRVADNRVECSDKMQGLREFRKILKRIKAGDFRVEKTEVYSRWQMRLFPK